MNREIPTGKGITIVVFMAAVFIMVVWVSNQSANRPVESMAIPGGRTNFPKSEDGLKEKPAVKEERDQDVQKASALSIYDKWKMPPEIIERNKIFFSRAESSDCIGIENGDTGGGDLLSSLIADQDARKKMVLKAYTPEYIIQLERSIAKATQKKYGSDFYAFSVCHLRENVDVVAGSLWPEGKATTLEEGKFAGETDPAFGQRNILVVVEDFEPVFFEGIQTMDNTATGAEVMPCKVGVAKDDDHVLWTCFKQLHQVEGGVEGADMVEWTLPIQGGKPGMREYVE